MAESRKESCISCHCASNEKKGSGGRKAGPQAQNGPQVNTWQKGQPEISRLSKRRLSITPKALWSEAVDFRLGRAKTKKKEEIIDEKT